MHDELGLPLFAGLGIPDSPGWNNVCMSGVRLPSGTVHVVKERRVRVSLLCMFVIYAHFWCLLFDVYVYMYIYVMYTHVEHDICRGCVAL